MVDLTRTTLVEAWFPELRSKTMDWQKHSILMRRLDKALDTMKAEHRFRARLECCRAWIAWRRRVYPDQRRRDSV